METNLKELMQDTKTLSTSFTITIGQDKKLRDLAKKYSIKKSQIVSKMIEELSEEKLIALFTKSI